MVQEKMTIQLKHAIILSLDNTISEIVQLADTLGYTVKKEFIQLRQTPDVNYYVGSGKVDEIKTYLDETEDHVDLVIVNGELKPSQWFTLEKKLGTTVYDRIRLILAIFEEHAERREARLQVRLAQLHYERPQVRELIHRAKAGEHPGLMAGGEYQVDDYYEMIKRQMKDINVELEKIRKNREMHRESRYTSGFYLVSLAGYTNAGKSSLLNLLTKETVKVEGKLFSTLSTTTRKIQTPALKRTLPVLLTDTVGFIEHLPSWVIDAFHSTLEEIQVADVVLLVADGSEELSVVERKISISLQELRNLNVTAPILIALNKVDLISVEKAHECIQSLHQHLGVQTESCLPISVTTQYNIDRLLEIIEVSLPSRSTLTCTLPNTPASQKFLSFLYETTHVLNVTYGTTMTIIFECNEKIKQKILSQCHAIGGSCADDVQGVSLTKE